MKRAILIIGLIASQVIAVLLLARIARLTAPSLPGAGVAVFAAVAYGIPALIAFICHYRFALAPASRLWSRVVYGIIAACFTFFGHLVSISTLQRTDMWLTDRYIDHMQARLRAEQRFAHVRLICYSDSYVLFPYIPVSGSVPSEEDRRALTRIFRDSHPPAYISAVVLRVGDTPFSIEEFARRTRED